jgi:curved DNA-binding protein CbpA
MDALPPDPYLALGVAKDATAAAIKTQYRKLVLKCHPDKIQDETVKQEAADKFHKIQTAYEVVGDDERRARYDAQCKLADLRKDVLGDGRAVPRNGGVDVRTTAYKMPTESARGGDFYARGPERFARVSPQYEERRPSYAQEDYFDQARPTSRKYDEYERPSKRSSPKEERPKTKASTRDAKENERSSRKEKSRRTEKDIRRDRERKTMHTTVEVDSESDSDPQERISRRMRAEDEEARYQRARDQYYEQVRRQKEDAENGLYTDDRTRKLFTDKAQDAVDYIARSRDQTTRARTDSERRPSPVRQASSKEKIQVGRREAGKQPVMYRTGSGRPKPTTRDSTRSTREKERQPEAVEEIREPRRGDVREKKPSLNSSKSAPEDIRPPFVRQRSHSMQDDNNKVEPPVPQMRRSETMPTAPAGARESRGRKEGSKLRPEDAYVTPERTPEPETKAPKYRYGHGQEYADDVEFPTPDGYRTEVREPSGSRHQYTRSPSPIKQRERERQRSASDRRHGTAPQPPPLPRTTSTQYVYPGGAREDSYSRPAVSRENSGRLYGEVRAHSPRQSYTFSPPPEHVSVRPTYGPEDVKIQTGYTRRPEKPGYSRGSSGRQAVYA